jgi:hypothetical protein
MGKIMSIAKILYYGITLGLFFAIVDHYFIGAYYG